MSSKDLLSINYGESARLQPLEAEVLTQYQHLAVQLNTLASEIKKLNASAAHETDQGDAEYLLDNLRNLEVKIGLVYTQFKGAVYLLFLQHEESLNLQNERGKKEEEEEEQSDEKL